MEHFKKWLEESKFKLETNGYFRNTKHEKDSLYHDCYHEDGEVCLGCRACIFTKCELTHAYLCFYFSPIGLMNK